MRRNNILAVIVICSLMFSSASAEQGTWKKEAGYFNEKVTQLFIAPEEESPLFIGTENTIYILDFSGKKLMPSLIAGGSKLNVYAFEFIPGSPGQVLAATDKGLFSSRDKGRTWQKQNFRLDAQSQPCFSLLYDHKNQRLYVGTAKGLYSGNPGGADFEREAGIASNRPVYKIAQDQDFFYAVTSQEVVRFRISALGRGEIIYKLLNKEEIDEDSLAGGPGITEMVVSPDKSALFMVLPVSGILKSDDHGGQWQEFPSGGILGKDINKIIFCPAAQQKGTPPFPASEPVCLAAREGAYIFQNKDWVRLDRGIAAQEITTLTVSPQGVIYAATDAGIYSMAGIPSLRKQDAFSGTQEAFGGEFYLEGALVTKSPSSRDLKPVYDDDIRGEPTIQEVHQMVIDYADVSPGKIKDWKERARMKALLPSFSVGLDREGGNLFHWNTAVNPDELQKGRDYVGWDVSLSWDFSDFIWSSEQTSIDSRAKLMVELREDLLSQVTRIYFERRRIQMEILNEDPGATGADASFERQLRIAELTAIIDAMTGGRFSRKIGACAR